MTNQGHTKFKVFQLDLFLTRGYKSYGSVVRIPSDEAIATSRTLGSEEGFQAGISSGAAIAALLLKLPLNSAKVRKY